MKNKRIQFLLVSLALSLFLINDRASAEIDATKIIKKTGDSIVCIFTGSEGNLQGLGSGVIVKGNGVIVTNFHVIHGADYIAVKLTNGDIFDDIEIVDYNIRFDIAVIKAKAVGLKPATLGVSDKVQVGEEVVAIGNPQGLENTISKGIIGQIRDTGNGYKYFQSDATISQGSSGGALINKNGEVIGITTSGHASSAGENLNFSLPIKYVIPYISDVPKMTLAEFYAETMNFKGYQESQPSDNASNTAQAEQPEPAVPLDSKGWSYVDDVRALLNNNNVAKALDKLDNCGDKINHRFFCQYLRGAAHLINGNNAKAKRFILDAIEYISSDVPDEFIAKAHHFMGEIYRNDSLNTQALEELEKALMFAEDKDLIDKINLEISYIYGASSNWAKAIVYGNKSINSKNTLIAAYANSGVSMAILQSGGNLEEAARYLAQAVQLDPNNGDFVCQYALLHVQSAHNFLVNNNGVNAKKELSSAKELIFKGLDMNHTDSLCRKRDIELINSAKDSIAWLNNQAALNTVLQIINRNYQHPYFINTRHQYLKSVGHSNYSNLP